jgi:hypothetical protein
LKRQRAFEEGLGLCLLISASLFFTFGYFLATGRVPVGNGLYALYFGYAFCGIVACHLLFFSLNSALRDRQSRHRKRLPKYIEYLYAAIISIGFAQVFMSSTRIVDYLRLTVGDEDSIAAQIQAVAQGYMAKECKSPGSTKYFTKEYCAKVKKVAEATEPKDFIVQEVLDDHDFVGHTIDVVAIAPGRVVYVESTIKQYADQLSALRGYSARPTPVSVGSAFSWVALLLLPIAIALRLTKTSLELFGGEDGPGPEAETEKLSTHPT